MRISSVLIKAGVALGCSCFMIILYVGWVYLSSNTQTQATEMPQVVVEKEKEEAIPEIVPRVDSKLFFGKKKYEIGDKVVLDEFNNSEFKDYHSILYWNGSFPKVVKESESFKLKVNDKKYKCKVIARNEGSSSGLICSVYQPGMYGFGSFVDMYLLEDSLLDSKYEYSFGDRIVSLVSDEDGLVISAVIRNVLP